MPIESNSLPIDIMYKKENKTKKNHIHEKKKLANEK